MLFIKKSNMHGFGVFTDIDIDEDTIIDFCYIQKLDKEDHFTISNYHYVHDNERYLILGIPFYVNHSNIPNCKLIKDKNELGFDILKTKSIKKINKGDEITVLYFEGVVI